MMIRLLSGEVLELCLEVVYGQRRKKGRILLDKQKDQTKDTP